jgi:superfamily II DNA or RNA helicase
VKKETDGQIVGAPDQDTGTSLTGEYVTLTAEEDLKLQQLLQVKFWSDFKKRREDTGPTNLNSDAPSVLPAHWELTRGINLHDWQAECVRAWFAAGKRGIAKVVTGAGKTLLGFAIAEKLQHENPELRIAIVAPSVVLMEQWWEEFRDRSNLPADAIGCIGGGYSDHFDYRVRVLICVLNSASKKLKEEVSRAGVGKDLFLIVDECHRAGATEMRQVFGAERAYSLGLSATPERDDAKDEHEEDDDESLREPESFEETVLGRELGSVIYELNYAEAIRRGILPPFAIAHYGLALRPHEAERNEVLSREITELRNELEAGSRRGLALIRWCRSKAAAGIPQAARLVSLTSERKRLLYSMQERRAAVLRILDDALRRNAQTKAILFHESIDEVMALFEVLRLRGYRVVAEHSGFPDYMRAESLRLFRQGKAQIVVSARSLIEGFNVPSADLGIVVAASASVRQRIQTLGRLLRKNQQQDGHQKSATLCVLYASGTVDELIYEKADWEHFVGAQRNIYYRWPDVASTIPIPSAGPPRKPVPSENEIDPALLVPKGEYPGNIDEGPLFSIDTQGTIRDEHGRLIEPHAELQQILANSMKGGGRFRVTPRKGFVTRLEKVSSGWRGVYLGRLDLPVKVIAEAANDVGTQRVYDPGESYPLPAVRGSTYSVLQRDPRLVARKSKGSIQFVVPLEKIADAEKRRMQEEIQRRLEHVYAQGHRISKITVTPEGHVVYVWQNGAYFVGQAPEGSVGFVFEGDEPRNLD